MGQIRQFWGRVFNWNSEDSPEPPSLEDHFTQIDVAANAGHNLGGYYTPRRLRALRRMSIHRIFTLLDHHPAIHAPVQQFLSEVMKAYGMTIVTTNWDIVAERYLGALGIRPTYGAVERYPNPAPPTGPNIMVLKLHGSADWSYCDSCRTFKAWDGFGKAVLSLGLLLEPSDFRHLKASRSVIRAVKERQDFRKCGCGCNLAARVGAFSYRKALNLPAFQTIWDEAQEAMRGASRWLFIGYSLPEADIEIRCLLKGAELARKRGDHLSIEVVLGDDCPAAGRYRSFFGLSDNQIRRTGLQCWIATRSREWLRC